MPQRVILVKGGNMKAIITDEGRISGITVNQAFQVALNDGTNPQISPEIDFTGMPVEVMAKLAFDALKVRGRGSMRGMKEAELKKVYSGKISWRVMYSKAGAIRQQAEVSLSDDEITAQIEELKEQQEKREASRIAVEAINEVDEMESEES